MTFTLSFHNTCPSGCNNSNYGLPEYRIWLNVSVHDTTANTIQKLPGYVNGTATGSLNQALRYSAIPVVFHSKLPLVVGDSYYLQLTLTSLAQAEARGPTGTSSTTIDLGSHGNGAWLQSWSAP